MSRTTDSIQSATRKAGNPPGHGPFLWVTLDIAGGVILQARYETYQCPGCIACGRAISEMVHGKRLEDLGTVTRDALIEKVGPLAKHRESCYALAVLALDDAVKQSTTS